MRSETTMHTYRQRYPHTYRQRNLFNLPKHPTIAGWFWLSYFVILGWLIFG